MAAKEVDFSFCLPKSLSLSEIPGQSPTNPNCHTFADPLLWLAIVYWRTGDRYTN